MNKLIVLQVPFWAKHDFAMFNRCDGEIIPPIIKRYGYYIDRFHHFAWIECKHGCKIIDYETAILDFKVLNHILLTDKEQSAINVLIQSKKANKELQQLYHFDSYVKNLIRLERNSKKIRNLNKKLL